MPNLVHIVYISSAMQTAAIVFFYVFFFLSTFSFASFIQKYSKCTRDFISRKYCNLSDIRNIVRNETGVSDCAGFLFS